jgi:amino acid transporter
LLCLPSHIGRHRHPQAPVSSAFGRAGLPWAEFIVALGALIGISSVLLVTLIAQPRILYAMARDGLLPKSVFGVLHPEFATPHKGVVVVGVLVALAAGCVPVDVLVEMVSIGTLAAFTLVNLCVIVLRRTRPQAERAFRVPLSPLFPMLGALLCLLLMLSLSLASWLRLVGWWVIGLLLYAWSRRRLRLTSMARMPQAEIPHAEGASADTLIGAPLHGRASSYTDDFRPTPPVPESVPQLQLQEEPAMRARDDSLSDIDGVLSVGDHDVDRLELAVLGIDD